CAYTWILPVSLLTYTPEMSGTCLAPYEIAFDVALPLVSTNSLNLFLTSSKGSWSCPVKKALGFRTDSIFNWLAVEAFRMFFGMFPEDPGVVLYTSINAWLVPAGIRYSWIVSNDCS